MKSRLVLISLLFVLPLLGAERRDVGPTQKYPEFSATAMIATAMLRGVRNGWLDSAVFMPRVEKAWQAILVRTSSDGHLVDVCESTNKQRVLDDYLHCAAILDRDPRGGAMALYFATEMAGLK